LHGEGGKQTKGETRAMLKTSKKNHVNRITGQQRILEYYVSSDDMIWVM